MPTLHRITLDWANQFRSSFPIDGGEHSWPPGIVAADADCSLSLSRFLLAPGSRVSLAMVWLGLAGWQSSLPTVASLAPPI